MEKKQPGILSFVVLKNPGLPLVFVTNHVNNPCFHRICHFVDAKISYIVSLILLATKYKNISLVITYFGKFTVISSDVTFP